MHGVASVGAKAPARSGNRKKMISGPQPRCWLDLTPLSARTALRTSPPGDPGGSTELVEPPWLVMRTSPGEPAAGSELWLKRGGRAKRLEVRRHASSPVARLPCWCLRRGRACRAWARRPGAAPRPRAQGQHRLLWGGRWWIHKHPPTQAPCTPALAHTSSLDTDLTRNTRAPHFTPQHWLLCHMGLY